MIKILIRSRQGSSIFDLIWKSLDKYTWTTKTWNTLRKSKNKKMFHPFPFGKYAYLKTLQKFVLKNVKNVKIIDTGLKKYTYS